MTAKGTTVLSGYGSKHKKLRKRWAKVVRPGAAVCNRCGEAILPDEPWDLDHSDEDRRFYRGPAHARCNRATAAHRVEREKRKSAGGRGNGELAALASPASAESRA